MSPTTEGNQEIRRGGGNRGQGQKGNIFLRKWENGTGKKRGGYKARE